MNKKPLCNRCNKNESKGNSGLCDSCRLKDWRKKNPEKIKTYLKRTKEHRKKYNKEYYERNRLRLNELVKAWRKRNKDYTYNTPKKRRDELIRRTTRYKYPLTGQKCEFCNRKAEERHHTTDPIKADEFAFVCNYHHNKLHGKRCVISKDGEKGGNE